jgi:translocation and assembly module TamB
VHQARQPAAERQFYQFQISYLTGFYAIGFIAVNGTIKRRGYVQRCAEATAFTSDITITDLSLKQDTIGNIRLKVSNTSMERYVADVTLTGRGNDVQITGPLVLQGKDVLLDLNVAVRALQLNSMEGALATFVSDASGTITGNIAVRGTTTQPKFRGL